MQSTNHVAGGSKTGIHDTFVNGPAMWAGCSRRSYDSDTDVSVAVVPHWEFFPVAQPVTELLLR